MRLGGIEANFWRITLAFCFLGICSHLFGQGVSGAGFPMFLLSGLAGFGVGDVALYQAYPRLGSRLSVMLVHCLAAPFAAFLEWLWMGTTLTGVQMLASATILAGVCLALAPGQHLHVPRKVLWAGIAFGVLAGLGQGLGAVISRRANQIGALAGEPVDGITAAYQRIIAGWIVGVVMMIMMKRGVPGPGTANGGLATNTHLRVKWSGLWYWVIINALAGPAIGVSCYQWALATAPTGIVLPIIAITPIVVIPFSRVMEGERPRPLSLLGGIVAVIGAVLLAVFRN